jgi:hypothetical protein
MKIFEVQTLRFREHNESSVETGTLSSVGRNGLPANGSVTLDSSERPEIANPQPLFCQKKDREDGFAVMEGNNEREFKDKTMGTKPFTIGNGALPLRDLAVKPPARRYGRAARELHQLADELNRLGFTKEAPSGG